MNELYEQGSVPELKIINKGENTVFILHGEELSYAKQNRILNI
ncbi:MAG: ARPP-1 family domain-containing protein [Methanomicrobiales archaeon]